MSEPLEKKHFAGVMGYPVVVLTDSNNKEDMVYETVLAENELYKYEYLLRIWSNNAKQTIPLVKKIKTAEDIKRDNIKEFYETQY